AIPYLWKKEGTNCENLPETHQVVKFFRAIIDYLRPDTLLLAEACQPPNEVVKYFGNQDECHAGYHFPLMPQIFKAFALEQARPIMEVRSEKVTPAISNENQWFTFLRVHDELTLEMVTEEDRKIIHDHYCRDPRWDFREGEGVAARLADLLEFNPQKYAMAYSVMLTLPGTPLVYYGDEFGKPNDEEYFEEQVRKTGYKDARYFVRGRVDWKRWNKELEKSGSFHAQVFDTVKNQLEVRKNTKVFGHGTIDWLEITDREDNPVPALLAFLREYEDEQIMVVHNLSGEPVNSNLRVNFVTENSHDMLGQEISQTEEGYLLFEPYAYHWFKIK
ncbi:MAG: alpha-glucosidase C-terminal domain-containing protein, partial [Bacteroidota bacterium]